MLDIAFSFVLGFLTVSTFCGLYEDGSSQDRMLISWLLRFAMGGFFIGLLFGGAVGVPANIRDAVVESAVSHWYFVMAGAIVAMIIQLDQEGHFHNLWVRFHPQSAPTPEVKAGQRARVAGFHRAAAPATLVGASTQYLCEELDLRTQTLILLAFSAFESRGAYMLSRLESALRVGTGRKQKAFHKLAAGLNRRPNAKKTVHRYWRSVNGSSRMGQSLFTDLCRLARETGNHDKRTVDRLVKIGEMLGLEPQEMGRAIQAVR